MVSPADILEARILVVDDAPANVVLLERMLGAAGYSDVTTTTDPLVVCALHHENRYDLILLDILMPGMDGFEVMQGLKEIEEDGYLPVLVLTAQPDHKLPALQAGAKDFVSKPFDRVEVLTRIENMLEVRLLLRESRTYSKLLEHYDQLTGLPNRTLFLELLTKALARPEPAGGVVSVLFVAVDRFSTVNDAMGPPAHDLLLRCVGDRLVGCIGPMDVAARLEGERFGLLVVGPPGAPCGGGVMARKVREALASPLDPEGFAITMTASVGISSAPCDSQDADTLLMYANLALQDGRAAGGDTHRFYSTAMNARAVHNLELETALQGALARNEFVLHYQPKVRVDTGEWSGVEALLRWDRPGHGLTPPSGFISILEETGLIVPVGAWVIETVCHQIREWTDSDVGPMRVAVNVSGRQFLEGGLVPTVKRAMLAHNIAPEWLDLEITESSLMSRRAEVDEVILDLKTLGVWLAIDDFGTGYSSLAYLKRFPIDTLKIDISFIRDITTNADGAAIAVAIINMARSLKMKVIAEGVETQSQFEFLRRHACDEIQGFYSARPMPSDELGRHRKAHCLGAATGVGV
jgi:diguanylate cyclase (GGDEF)-like protein